MLDLLIIGAGPAALTAAIYAARAGLHTTVYEKSRFGGALPEISHLANFPGFDGTGEDFTDNLVTQARKAGAKVTFGDCTAIDANPTPIATIDNEPISAHAILIATGSGPRRLNVDTKSPVSYCVLCDGDLYKDKNVCVVGGGNSAIGESIHLAKIAKSVTVIARSCLTAQAALIDELKTHANVKIMENTTPTAGLLDSFDGVFVLIGKCPATSFVPQELLDHCGAIKTDAHFMTSIPGIFAAGDVRSGSIKQAITAAGEGAAAAIAITDYLKDK